MPKVSHSLSIKWGVAPEYIIEFAVPIKVMVGTRTSSLLLTPQATKLKCKASVPLTTEIAYLDFVNFFIWSSNLLTKEPIDET